MPLLVIYGNSYVAGVGASSVALSFPGRIRAGLTGYWDTQIVGRSGNTAQQCYFAMSDTIIKPYATTSDKWLLFYEGTNCGNQSTYPKCYRQLTLDLISAGWNVIHMTTATPQPGIASYYGILQGNKIIRNDYAAWGAKGYVEIANDPIIGSYYNNATYYPDAVHPNDTACQLYADLCIPTIRQLASNYYRGLP